MIKPDIPNLDPMRLQVRKHALLNEISTKPSRRWWRLAVPVTALAAAVAISVALWPVSNPSAFASWSAEPRAPGSREQAIASGCQDVIARWRETVSGVAPTPTPVEASLVDRRGDTTLVAMAGPQGIVYCLYAPGITIHGTSEIGDGETWFRASPKSGFSIPGFARILTGHVRPAVRRVVISTEDGRQVIATLTDGWVAAWWPSEADASSVTTYDEAGHVLETVTPENR
ncbi:hypothetical protein AB0E59_44770 [Lentzea sp. NPDC034063]|uniref:hypothetical protein n=1 Tax=unclassified Lentzea TaxID=2643253 RepID=UPI00341120AE